MLEQKKLAAIVLSKAAAAAANNGGGDIVIYDNASGATAISNIALEIGATYDFYITSAFDGPDNKQYGQQKITLKLIPAENTPNNYVLYMPVHYYEVSSNSVETIFMNIYNNYDNELWNVVSVEYISIYKIIKKAV